MQPLAYSLTAYKITIYYSSTLQVLYATRTTIIAAIGMMRIRYLYSTILYISSGVHAARIDGPGPCSGFSDQPRRTR